MVKVIKRYLIFIAVMVLGLFIGVVYANKLNADDFDPYEPAPGAFQGLTAKEIQDKEQELRATKDIDRHAEISRGGSRTINMEATAYCLTTPTFTGDKTGIGVVAADPEIIPLYSRLWIDGYGYAVVMDTGKVIRGNRIDVWLPTQEDCLQWGRQIVEVRILDLGGEK